MFVLEESNKLYDKLKIGMSKSEVISIMGEPDEVSSIIVNTENLCWKDEYGNSYFVAMEDNKLDRKIRKLYSNSYESIQLSIELGTEIENLEVLVSKVEHGMTLGEIEAILGDKYFESGKTSDGEVVYTWFDKLENSFEVHFDQNAQARGIGSVEGSY